ncbi:MAG: hypothetical protein WDN24_11235 [Sphingomonas sp.]
MRWRSGRGRRARHEHARRAARGAHPAARRSRPPAVADERHFLVRAGECAIDSAGHTELERRVMREWRWFEPREIADWPETIFPEDLHELLEAIA